MNILVKDLAICERPYEKAEHFGISVLSDAELLAIIMRSGTKDTSVLDLANRVLNAHNTQKGLLGLHLLLPQELMQIPGIGKVKSMQLQALAEISKRMNLEKLEKKMDFHTPDTIGAYYREKCRFLNVEKTLLLLLTNAHTLIKEIELSTGTVNQAHMSPREIFVHALRYEAVYIVLVHNHPSGNVTPSEADIQSTLRIRQAGEVLGIGLSDHIVVAGDSYFSMLERGIL